MKHFVFFAFFLFSQAAFALTPAASLLAKIETVQGPVNLNLEIVNTPDGRATGLMHRKDMGSLDGMVFLFPQPVSNPFWMKNTLMPLDIIFVSAEGRITYIGRNTTPQSLAPVGNGVPYQTTIEIAGGRAAKEKIEVGQRVQFQIPKDIHVQ